MCWAEEKKRQCAKIEKRRKEGAEVFLKELIDAEEKGAVMSAQELQGELARLQEARQERSLNTLEEKQAEVIFQRLLSLLSQKKEEALFESEEDPQFLENLKGLLQKRLDERLQCKKQLELYRKEVGGSGLDFEQSIRYQEQLASGKEALEHVEKLIAELEDKIGKLQD